MATTEHFYTGNNSTTSFAFTFPYLSNSDVKVELDNVVKTENSSGQTNNDYTINNTNIVFNSAPGTGVAIHIYRTTNVDSAQAQFAAGSSIRAADLNNNQTQLLYSAQEAGGQLIRQTDLKDGIVNSAKITDGSIVDGDVNASAAIAGTKVSPNFGSQNIQTSGTAATGALGVTGNITVSGTVDGRDVAADGTKLDTVETNAKDDQTAAEIRTLVESATDSNVFTDADHTKLNGIEASATADQTNAEIRAAVEAATDSNVFTDADHTKLNGIEASATADQTISEIKTLIAGSPLDASHLAADSVTTSEIADAELTTLASMQSGTASILASGTALTSTTTELNQLDGKTLGETSLTTNSDTAIPTSKAVADFVSATVAPIGGLEVISNEVSFPNTQPAAGVVISISDAGGVVFNGSGVSTTGRTVGGATVTINNAPSSLNSETLVSGVGMMVSSTGSSQTYNYHKILGKEDDIKQLSDDINDFNARYRVGSSNPTSALDSGDMFFNTSTGKMMVYDGTQSAWEEVQSIGNFFISTFSESFDGSRTAFTVSNAPTSAQQLIISINGVIQKPNAGTGQPSEGFTLSGSTVTFSSAIPSGSDSFVIVLGSAVNQGTPSNNTVTEAILQSNVVSEEKLKVSNTPTNGYFLSAQSGNSGGLTWAQVNTELVNDTSPQLGGYLDTNGNQIRFHNSVNIDKKTAATNAVVSGITGHVKQNSLIIDGGSYDIFFTGGTSGSKYTFGSSDGLTHEVMRITPSVLGASQHGKVDLRYVTANAGGSTSSSTKLSTTSTGVTVTGTVAATSYTGDGSNLTGIASTVGGGAIYENSQTISATHTIPTGSNGMSAGPVTVNNGITLTVSSGSTYTIV